jgi:hypothetical protein
VAQGIKQQSQQHKQQQTWLQQIEQKRRENELKEQARLKRFELSLNDLLLLQKKGLSYVSDYLSNKDWTLEKTQVLEFGYIDDFFTSYDAVVWSFEKNSYNNKAKAWFHLYQYSKLENAIVYQTNKDHFKKIRSEIQNSSTFKRIKTETQTEGLVTIYRGNNLEIRITECTADSDTPNHDNIMIFNLKEIEERRQIEAARRAREYAEQQRREKEEYEEQLRIEKEVEKLRVQVQNHVNQAKAYENQKRYNEAIAAYNTALFVYNDSEYELDNFNAKEIEKKIAELDQLVVFLKLRKTKVYDYKEQYYTEYERINNKLLSEIKALVAGEKNITPASLTFTLSIDTAGVVTRSVTSSSADTKLKEQLQQITTGIQLTQPYMYGYTVAAQAVFSYTISKENAIIKVKNKTDGFYSKSPLFDTYYDNYGLDKVLRSAPYGKLVFQSSATTINGKHTVENNLVKYHRTGGPANAWLSLLVPGLGKHRVTFGEKSGVGTALWTYSLIGTGVGLKLYSNSQYRKYMAATDQSAMDTHYANANAANQFFYVFAGTAGIIWISDILWVWHRGAQNKKTQKAWKQAHLGFYYEPQYNIPGLAYTFNF